MDTVKGYSFSTQAVEDMNFAVNGPNDERLEWDAIDWRIHESIVVRLRRRIFKATREQTRNALAACLSRGAGKARSPGSDPNPRVVARHGLQMMIGALLTWDDGGYHATIIWVERTPIGWTGYAVCAGYGGWWVSAHRMGR